MSSTNRLINLIERVSTNILGPAPTQEKLKSISAATGQGLYRGSYGQRPKNIKSYYDWYDTDGAVYAGINSITEMAVGNGFETALPGLAPSDMEDEDSPEKKLVDEFNEYVNADELNANICRNILIAGFCFPPEQEIITAEGIKEIKDINVADDVLTLNGFNFVYGVMNRPYKGKMIKAYPYRNGLGISMTPDHPVLVLSAKRCPIWGTMFCKPTCKHRCSNKLYEDYKFEWKIAEELTTEDFVIQPIPKFDDFNIEKIEISDDCHANPFIVLTNEEFFYMLGFYLGDGFFSGRKQENICFELNKKDTKSLEKLSAIIKKLGRKPQINDNDTSITLKFTYTALSDWIKNQLGTGCETKTIPIKWLGLPETKKRALIQGLFDSDGSLRDNRYTLSLINKHVIETVYLLLISMGKAPSISSKEMPDCIINNKTYATKTQYVLRIHKKQYDEDVEAFFNGYKHDGLLFNRINKIETYDYDGYVYNIGVDNEPHINTVGMLTHNCPVEVKMSKYPRKCQVGVIHPKTVAHIELGGTEYHGIKYIIQKVNQKEVKIMGKNLAWFDHNKIGNDKRGKSIIAPLEVLLSTKLNTINQIEKIIDKRLAPMIIWKSMRNVDGLKEAVTGIKPDEDIFLGDLTQEELANIAQVIDIGDSSKLWEYIEYIDRLIYKSLFTGDLDYWRQATQASATVLQELVDYNVRGIERSIKRGCEAGFYTRLMELNNYTTIPRISWTTENAKFRGIQLERFLQTGVNAGFVQLEQYFEILQKSGLDLHPPKEAVLPPQPTNPIIKKTPDIEK